MKITLISQSAADSFEVNIDKKFAKLLAMSDKKKQELIDTTEEGDSGTFVDSQEVATLEYVKVKGNKITVYPSMDLLDGSLSSIKPKMQAAFDKWASKYK